MRDVASSDEEIVFLDWQKEEKILPANLTPDYMAAEKRFRAAKTDSERLEHLQEMLRHIPKHKGTDKMQADIKRRISKLKGKLEQQSKGKKKGPSYKIHPEGAGAVALVGPPNVGKSSLFTALTGVEARIADYPYTTIEPQPGMMPYENVKVELVDLPPISVEHTEPWVFDLIKSCHAFLLVVDLDQGDPLEEFQESRRLLDRAHVQPLWRENEEADEPAIGRRCRIVATKADAEDADDTFALFQEMLGQPLPLSKFSAMQTSQADALRKDIYDLLGVIRVYSKIPGHDAEMDSPFTVPKGSTLIEFAQTVHQDFAENLKFGRVWGGSKFDGMMVKRDYLVQDGDVVELHI